NFLELAVDLPVRAYWAGDATNFGQPILANAGVGDFRFAPKFLFWRGGNRDLHGSVGLIMPVSFPSGDEQALRGSGGFVIDPRLLMGIGGWRWELYMNGGYQWRSVSNTPVGYGEITYGVGMLVTLPVWHDRIDLNGELVGGFNHAGTGSALAKAPLEALVGLTERP